MNSALIPPCVAPETVGFSASRLARLTGAFQNQIERQRLPGVVAMAMRQGQVFYCEALGRRDPAHPDAMRVDDIFRIYSMTKPLVSVAAMMLFEEGRLFLNDPLEKHVPEFRGVRVGVVRDGQVETTEAVRGPTVHDLLRHTAGFTYEILPEAPLRRQYIQAKIYRRDWTNEQFAKALATLPLMHQPGTVWEYSRATDVLGRVVEVVSGRRLRDFIHERILAPLSMVDTGFDVPPASHHRLAEPFSADPDTRADVRLLDVRTPFAMDMGGGGMVSTAADYMRFMQMMLQGGAFEGHRLLSRKTVALMTSDHLGGIPGDNDLLSPGHGFGLGFSVRLHGGMDVLAGSAGLYYWGGLAGTTFFIDPAESLCAVLMVQAPGQRDEVRSLFRNLLYAAFDD